jgi:hypothetical protein
MVISKNTLYVSPISTVPYDEPNHGRRLVLGTYSGFPDAGSTVGGICTALLCLCARGSGAECGSCAVVLWCCGAVVLETDKHTLARGVPGAAEVQDGER